MIKMISERKKERKKNEWMNERERQCLWDQQKWVHIKMNQCAWKKKDKPIGPKGLKRYLKKFIARGESVFFVALDFDNTLKRWVKLRLE